MSDIRFICSQCQQHLECDDAWCGNVIACPGCSQEILIPHYVVFASSAGAKPPTAKSARSVRPAGPPTTGSTSDAYAHAYGLYTESDWDKLPSVPKPMRARRFKIGILVGVGLLGFVLMLGGTGLTFVALAIGAAVVAGCLFDESGEFSTAVGKAALMLVLFAAVAVGVLFVGCAAACNGL